MSETVSVWCFTYCAIATRKVCLIPRFPRLHRRQRRLLIFLCFSDENQMLPTMSVLYSLHPQTELHYTASFTTNRAETKGVAQSYIRVEPDQYLFAILWRSHDVLNVCEYLSNFLVEQITQQTQNKPIVPVRAARNFPNIVSRVFGQNQTGCIAWCTCSNLLVPICPARKVPSCGCDAAHCGTRS